MDETLILRPFQEEGVDFFNHHGGRCICGDDMGLGKTVQALSYLKDHPNLRPAVIVVPASMKIKWAQETHKWTGEEPYVAEGRRPPTWLPACSIYIINYDILAEAEPAHAVNPVRSPGKYHQKPKKRLKPIGWYNLLISKHPMMVVADEAHFINNPDTIRTKAFLAIADAIPHRRALMLSGTPFEVCPAQFFTMLNLVAPKLFPSRRAYLHRYCDPKISYAGIKHWEYNGATNTEELHELVKTVMIRRLKKDVLKELPPKQKIIIPLALDPTEERFYRGVDRDFLDWIRINQAATQTDAYPHIAKLKQLAYIAKRNSVLQWIDEYLETANKLVLFCYHRRAVHDVYTYFRKIAVKMDGDTNPQDRQPIVDRFQEDAKCQLFVGQIKAAGVGHTLTAANAVAFAEFGQTALQHEQAEDRINRIGQEADSITAYYLIAQGTVDEDSMATLQRGYEKFSSVIDGRAADFFEGAETLDGGVFERYRRRALK